MTPREITRAAKVLREHARTLFRSYYGTLGWSSEPIDAFAKPRYKEALDLARKLEATAKARRDRAKKARPR